MAVYVDDLFTWTTQGKLKGQWCHCWTDGSVDELNLFADKIGLQRDWIQKSKGLHGEFTHYDLRPSKRKIALRSGAIYMPLREWIKRLAVACT